MKKWIGKALILIMLVSLPLTISAQENEYEMMTEEQVINWLDTIDLPTLVNFVQKYDYVEHTTPDISYPDYSLVVQGNDVTLSPIYDSGDSDTIKIGHLTYSVKWPIQTFEDVIPEPTFPWKTASISFGLGLIVGLITSGLLF